ncbi:MAG: hypothetical protein GX846_09800 [Deltaproteobacteria bacterium]|nr:hypothetical protein [Deltaproteobacteria bacterium]
MNKKTVLLLILVFISSIISAQQHSAGFKDAGTFLRISKQQDYGLSVTRLIIDLGEDSIINEKDILADTFTVTGTTDSGKPAPKIKGINVTDVFGDKVESGRYVTIDLDFGLETDSDTGSSYLVTLNQDIGAFKKGAQFLQKGRTIRR